MAQQHSKKTAHHQVHKSPANVQSAAKIATHSSDKIASAAFTAAESGRETIESMARLCTDTMKDAFANGAEETQKAHDKVFAVGRESSQNISRAIEALTRTLNDLVALCRENADATVEVGYIVADLSKSIHSEFINCANTNFADNLEICKEAFSCRNINDIYDLQSKWLSTNIDNFFAQSSRLGEMCFQLAWNPPSPLMNG